MPSRIWRGFRTSVSLTPALPAFPKVRNAPCRVQSRFHGEDLIQFCSLSVIIPIIHFFIVLTNPCRFAHLSVGAPSGWKQDYQGHCQQPKRSQAPGQVRTWRTYLCHTSFVNLKFLPRSVSAERAFVAFGIKHFFLWKIRIWMVWKTKGVKRLQ